MVGVAVGSGVYGAGVGVSGGVASASATSMVGVGSGVGVGVTVMTCPHAAANTVRNNKTGSVIRRRCRNLSCIAVCLRPCICLRNIYTGV